MKLLYNQNILVRQLFNTNPTTSNYTKSGVSVLGGGFDHHITWRSLYIIVKLLPLLLALSLLLLCWLLLFWIGLYGSACFYMVVIDLTMLSTCWNYVVKFYHKSCPNKMNFQTGESLAVLNNNHFLPMYGIPYLPIYLYLCCCNTSVCVCFWFFFWECQLLARLLTLLTMIKPMNVDIIRQIA